MNIIIVNEKKTEGGAEVYVKNLYKILKENGINVFIIYLNDSKETAETNEVILNLNGKFSFSFKTYIEIKRIIRNLKPDFILVNNVFSSPITVYAALASENNIQIVHDYSIVCPKSTCLTDDDCICNGKKKEKCIQKCTYHNSKFILMGKLILTKWVDWLRTYTVKKYISPSKKLAEYVNKNGGKCKTLPNPLFLNISASTKNIKNRNYVYIGGLNKNKGLYDMLPAFDRFAKEKQNVRLDIYGKCSNNDDYIFLKKYCNNFIVYHGYVKHEEIKDIIDGAYALIVPSFWMENYPTTVLEGFSRKTLVIGSNRGGIPELLSANRGICYSYGQDGLLSALNKANDLTKDEYEMLTENGVNYIKENNMPQIYLKRLMEFCLG